jgi:hypothetical protein
MNVTAALTKEYENKPPIRAPKKQTQTSKRQKPMQTSLPQRIIKESRFWAPKKQTQLVLRSLRRSRIKPNLSRRSLWRRRKQTQPVVSLPALLALSEVEGSLSKRAQSKGPNLFQGQKNAIPLVFYVRLFL